jgi:hypothetical protein
MICLIPGWKKWKNFTGRQLSWRFLGARMQTLLLVISNVPASSLCERTLIKLAEQAVPFAAPVCRPLCPVVVVRARLSWQNKLVFPWWWNVWRRTIFRVRRGWLGTRGTSWVGEMARDGRHGKEGYGTGDRPVPERDVQWLRLLTLLDYSPAQPSPRAQQS